MNKFVESNVRKLNKLKQERINSSNKITQATKNRLNQIVTLYKDRKIANVATAENFIKNLTSTNKRTAEKARDKYNETIKDFKKSKPLNERIAEKKGKDTYLVNFQLYVTKDPSKTKMKPAFTRNGKSFYIENFDIRQATVKAKTFDIKWIKKIIYKIYDTNDDNEIEKTTVLYDLGNGTRKLVSYVYTQIFDILKTDKDFAEFLKGFQQAYSDIFDAIKIQQVEKSVKAVRNLTY